MDSPTTRVLALLELLQNHDEISGPELARRLDVDTRPSGAGLCEAVAGYGQNRV